MSLLSTLKKAFGLSLLAGLAFSNAQAQGQAPDFSWAQVSNGTDTDLGNAGTVGIASDALGNSVVAGQYFDKDQVVFAGATLTRTDTTDWPIGSYLMKLDPAGNSLWSMTIHCKLSQPLAGDSSVNVKAVSMDNQGNSFITGGMFGNARFGTQVVTATERTSFVAKVSPAGSLLWIQQITRSSALHVKTDPAGNVYVYCYAASPGIANASASFTLGGVTLTTGDSFISKFTSTGLPAWTARIGNVGGDSRQYRFAVDGAGNSIVSGGLPYSLTIGNTTLTTSGSVSNYFVAKFDINGNPVWAKKGDVGPNNKAAWGTAADANGNIYLLGAFGGTANFGGTSLTSAGLADILLVKYDPAGTILWARRAGGTGDEGRGMIEISANGEVFVGGTYTSTINFGTTTLTNRGLDDVYTAKYDASGQLLWAQSIGSSKVDGLYGMTTDATGNCFVAGSTDGGVPINFSGISLTPAFWGEAFVAKLNANAGARISALPASVCKGSSFSIPFTTTGAFNAGNRFIAQLSGPTGSFADAVNIGEYSGTTSGTITATMPATASGSGYKVRIVSVSPVMYSTASTAISTTAPPSTPGAVTGSMYGVCANSTATYSIAAVAKATGYTWAAPAGATIISGQGTTSVTVSFGASFTMGTLTVKSNNTCGSSSLRSVTIKSVPSTPGTISGLMNGVCANTTATYSIPAVTGATGYSWTAPAGATITSGQGTTSVSVSFSGSFVSGSLSVKASNGCGVSAQKLATIKSVPSTPATVNGAATVCRNQAGVSFSVAAVTGATSYVWTVPAGAIITSGQGTASIQVTFGPGTGSMLVSVKAGNGCGYSALRSKAITVNSCVREMAPASEPVTFSVYPNPSNGVFTISYSATEKVSTTLQFFDVTGRLVKQQALTANEGSNSVEVTASELPKGMYLVELVSGTEVLRQRVVIE